MEHDCDGVRTEEEQRQGDQLKVIPVLGHQPVLSGTDGQRPGLGAVLKKRIHLGLGVQKEERDKFLP